MKYSDIKQAVAKATGNMSARQFAKLMQSVCTQRAMTYASDFASEGIAAMRDDYETLEQWLFKACNDLDGSAVNLTSERTGHESTR